MVPKDATRRSFLQFLGLVAGGSLLGCPPGNGGNGDGENGDGDNGNGENGDGTTIVVRGDVMGSGAGALDSYRAAIDAMKALPSSDPRSWQAQAEIHLDHCPHGNAFFLPWHRAYLQYFEQVIRAMSGDSGFALPYWNWTTQPTIPPAFWTGTLNDPTRAIGPTDPMPASAVGQPVIDAILAIADFETFGSSFVPSSCTVNCQRFPAGTGALEGTPHNIVHGTIGGNMGTYLSPLDPIFWLHHCNVDRLWVEWNKSFANPGNSFWRTFDFADNFVDGAGNNVASVIVDTLFDTFALGYRYDTQPEAEIEAVAPEAKTATVVASVEVETTGPAAEMGTALTIPVQLSAEVRERLEPGIEAAGAETTVRLSLAGLATPDDPVVVNVYLGGEAAGASPDSPNFVRSVGFFPTVAADDPMHHERTFLFDVGAKLAQLAGAGSLPVHVETQPLRAGIEAAGAGVRPSSVKIEVIELAA
jgi:hypothetical protein